MIGRGTFRKPQTKQNEVGEGPWFSLTSSGYVSPLTSSEALVDLTTDREQ